MASLRFDFLKLNGPGVENRADHKAFTLFRQCEAVWGRLAAMPTNIPVCAKLRPRTEGSIARD
jgi:hypothetical protein